MVNCEKEREIHIWGLADTKRIKVLAQEKDKQRKEGRTPGSFVI